jgi:hypothetical protein
MSISEQEYKCTGKDIHELYGAYMGLVNNVLRATQELAPEDRSHVRSIVNQTRVYHEDFPSFKQAQRIYIDFTKEQHGQKLST